MVSGSNALQGTWETNACADGERCITQTDGSGECMGVRMGSRRCNGDNREECNAQGQWETLACPAEERCVEDEDMVICRAGCDSGLLRCNGDTRAMLGKWRMGNRALPRY